MYKMKVVTSLTYELSQVFEFKISEWTTEVWLKFPSLLEQASLEAWWVEKVKSVMIPNLATSHCKGWKMVLLQHGTTSLTI